MFNNLLYNYNNNLLLVQYTNTTTYAIHEYTYMNSYVNNISIN